MHLATWNHPSGEKRTVAVKRPKADLSAEEAQAFFQAEIDALTAFKHRCVRMMPLSTLSLMLAFSSGMLSRSSGLGLGFRIQTGTPSS